MKIRKPVQVQNNEKEEDKDKDKDEDQERGLSDVRLFQGYTLYLNGAHKLIAYSVVSTGTATSAPVHPPEVYQPAILVGATAVRMPGGGRLVICQT